MSSFKFLLLLLPIISAFEIQIFNCNFKWGSGKAQPKPKIEEKVEEAPTITGYYWRDFHGKIPNDAFCISKPSQKTKSYLGWAYDPSLNGTFVTTIFAGQNFVYTTRDGKKNKVTKNIQILCTQERKRMKWIYLEPNGTKRVPGAIFVESGVKNITDSYPKMTYAARVVKDNLNYACDTEKRENLITYVDKEGNIKTDEYFEFLYYKNGELSPEEEEEEETDTEEPFFVTEFLYKFPPRSFIPPFYKYTKLGPLRTTCTNSDKESLIGGNQEGTNGAPEPDLSLDYHWLVTDTFSNDTAIITGKIYRGKDGYSCTAFDNDENAILIGYSQQGEACYIKEEKKYYGLITDTRIFATLTPEKFEWIQTNSTEVLKMDRTYFIRGGQYANGTEIIIGRRKNEKDGDYYASFVKLFDDKAYSFDYYERFIENFEVLSHVKS